MKTGIRARYFQKFKVRKTFKDNGNSHKSFVTGEEE
tara:strand:+ start:125 stop:232 length:108 start_codon:yes stop_codon:yes gene_type:complete